MTRAKTMRSILTPEGYSTLSSSSVFSVSGSFLCNDSESRGVLYPIVFSPGETSPVKVEALDPTLFGVLGTSREAIVAIRCRYWKTRGQLNVKMWKTLIVVVRESS